MANISKIRSELMKEVMSVMGERDESIRQSFHMMEGNMQKAFSVFDLKVAVVIRALQDMGMADTRLQEIANTIQAEISGGVNKDEQHGNTPAEGVKNSNEPEGDLGKEGGSEHFG